MKMKTSGRERSIAQEGESVKLASSHESTQLLDSTQGLRTEAARMRTMGQLAPGMDVDAYRRHDNRRGSPEAKPSRGGADLRRRPAG